MLDLGISKLALIGVVALIVIGPERLPRVARTVGTLLGRAQRYISEVKSEVNREMQIDELRAMHRDVKEAASSFETSVASGLRGAESDLNAALGDPATGPMPESFATAPTEIAPAKRRNWRRKLAARQGATPLWWKNANRKRTRVQSGAARVARYRARVSGAATRRGVD